MGRLGLSPTLVRAWASGPIGKAQPRPNGVFGKL